LHEAKRLPDDFWVVRTTSGIRNRRCQSTVQATLFPRQTGGRAQRFYTPVCRRACDVDVRHEAYRAWSNGYSIVLRVDPKPPPFMVKRATPVYRMKDHCSTWN